ncbi:MAG: hypothetical protein ACRENP_11590 [Longimicrobiales bacterium]
MTRTTTFALILVTLFGLGLAAVGLLFGVLGLWGVERGSPSAWVMALLGLLGILVGSAFVVWALKRMRTTSGA